MDLKRKIEVQLKNKIDREKNLNKNEFGLNRENKYNIENLIDGSEVINKAGKFYLIKKTFPYDYKHGNVYFKDISDVNLNRIRMFTNYSNVNGLKEFVFLDTETTGLSTGTGTIAFLLGVGYFDNSEFVIEQYFIRDYDEELAALEYLNNFISNKKAMVSFNGKVFDWNLLLTRFVFNKIKIKKEDLVHVDLLFPSRVLWKRKLESCRLISLEENILGIVREDDIPGILIPEVYFKYLGTKDARDIKKVVKHNQMDILSMVSLLIRIVTIIDDPICGMFDWYEIFGVSNMNEKCGNVEEAVSLYNHCAMSEDKSIKLEALKNLAVIFRRNKNYEKSKTCLEQILKYSDNTDVTVMIDLAKYYEHRIKDYDKAIEIVNNAIDRVFKFNATKKMYYNQLKHRLNRLERKKKIKEV